MAPNTVDCDRESKGSPSSPSPSQKHRRGKTGKARKKRRNWGLFSRWKTSESEDDDDLELYRWSKSRGLTARILTPQSATQPTENIQKTNRMRYHDYSESKSTIDQRANASKENAKRAASANTIAVLQEGIFLTKLCPSIRNKKLFVEQSKCSTEKEAKGAKKIIAEKCIVALPQKQLQKSIQQIKTPSCKGDDEGAEKVIAQQKSESNFPIIEKPPPKSAEEIKIDKRTCETSKEMNNETSHSGKQNASSPDPTSTSSPSPPSFHLSKKEWSASVESGILRLYESTSTVQTNTNLVYSWATPNVAPAPIKQNSVHQTVEQKIEQAEYTPSYVQMLAKMFKNRMQIRKEREERVEENLKRSKLSFDCVGNGTYSLKSDSLPPKTNSYAVLNPNPISKAHLRYRHLGDKKESHSNRLEITQTIRIDQLDVGYTHGRYSKALKYNPDYSYGKMSTANGDNPYQSEGSSAGHSSIKELAKCDEKSTEIHRGFFKLYDGDPSAKLQKPTPHLTAFKHASKQDTRSTLLLAKKARKSLSYSRTKPNEITDILRGDKPSMTHKDTNELFEYSASPVRWSTSVGSLYCRPPARILSRPTAQKA